MHVHVCVLIIAMIICTYNQCLCRLYHRPTATHEAATTRCFLLGRTDTIRSCTNAALTFVKTMVDPMATVSELKQAPLYYHGGVQWICDQT